jgi:hypothetical protein
LVSALHYTVQLDDNPQERTEHILYSLNDVMTLHFLLVPELTQEDREPVKCLKFQLVHHYHQTMPSEGPAQKIVTIIVITETEGSSENEKFPSILEHYDTD